MKLGVHYVIAGTGMNDALERAYSYSEAGADMILIYSKGNVLGEVKQFSELWSSSKPLVVVLRLILH